MQWNRTYGGADNDVAFSLATTPDGGYILAGATNYPIGDWLEPNLGFFHPDAVYQNVTAWIVKTDATGNMQWNKTFHVNNYNIARSILSTSDGGYAFCIATINATNDVYYRSYLWVVKTNGSGNTVWNKMWSYEDHGEGACSIVQTNDGGYAIAGHGTGSGGSFRLVKLGSDGSLQWNKTCGNVVFWGFPCSLIKTSDGGYALAGMSNLMYEFNFELMKIDGSGNLVWRKDYSSNGYNWGDDLAFSVIQTSDGGYALAGYWNCKWEHDYLFPDLEPYSAAMLVKTDGSGNKQWANLYNGFYDDGAYGVVEAPSGGYVLAGYTWTEGSGSYDVWLFKTDEYGVVPERWTLLAVFLFIAAIIPIVTNRKIRRV